MPLWQINEKLNERFEGHLPLFDIGRWKSLRETIRKDLNAHNSDKAYPVKPQRLISDIRKAFGTRRYPALRCWRT